MAQHVPREPSLHGIVADTATVVSVEATYQFHEFTHQGCPVEETHLVRDRLDFVHQNVLGDQIEMRNRGSFRESCGSTAEQSSCGRLLRNLFIVEANPIPLAMVQETSPRSESTRDGFVLCIQNPNVGSLNVAFLGGSKDRW